MIMTVSVNAMCVISKLCEFVFSHSEVIPSDITALNIGISPQYVSIRCDGSGLSEQGMREDLPAFVKGLQNWKVFELTVAFFDRVSARRVEYRFVEGEETPKAAMTEKADNAQPGVFVRAILAESEGAMEKVSVIWDALAYQINKMENPPSLEHVSIFLNGESMP